MGCVGGDVGEKVEKRRMFRGILMGSTFKSRGGNRGIMAFGTECV